MRRRSALLGAAGALASPLPAFTQGAGDFPNASSSSGEGGSAMQSPIPAAVQNLFVPNAELRNFLSTLGDQSN